MKKKVIIIVFTISMVLTSPLFAQVAINTDGSSANPSAMLDVKSDTAGLLIPRMTTAQRDAISSPAQGLMVFVTDDNSFYYYTGSIWKTVGRGATGWDMNSSIIYADSTHHVVIGNSTTAGTFEVVTDKATGTYTTDRCTSGSASAMEYQGSYVPAHAFDDDQISLWRNNGSMPVWVRYDLSDGNEKAIARYRMYWSGGNVTYTPKDWQFQASDDGTNWTTLDSRSNESWNSGEWRAFTFSNTTPYRYYQINITANNGAANNAVYLMEIEMQAMIYSNHPTLFVANNKVGIGTETPAATLEVNGTLNYTDGSEGAGKVLTSDASGNAGWTDGSSISNTLDAAYDQGGAGTGKNITADAGALRLNGTDGFLVTGTYGSGNTIDSEISGNGTRMFFNPNKAAFRAGNITGNQWDDANIGAYSIAMGSSTTASGNKSIAFGSATTASGGLSTAMGFNSTASGDLSTAMGSENNASGMYSTAMGDSTNASGMFSTAIGKSTTASGVSSVAMGLNTTASGDLSTAMGNNTNASGIYSTAMGSNTTAPSYIETSIGSYNTDYTPISNVSWDASDRLFVVGNGENSANKSNALTIYKDGRMNINDAYFMPQTDGTADQIMQTDGAGQMSFVDLSTVCGWSVSGDIIYNLNSKIGVGTSSPVAKLEVQNASSDTSVIFTNSSNSNSKHYGSYTTITGTGTGEQYGTYNEMIGTGEGKQYGTVQWLHSNGNGDKYGTFNSVMGFGTGDKYGTYNLISMGSPGIHYGVYSDAQGASNYAGYFKGNMYVQDKVGIGTSSPGEKLDVAGHIWQTSTGYSVFLGENAGSSDDLSDNNNVFIGYNAGNSNTSGYNNTAIGFEAMKAVTDGTYNTALGHYAYLTGNYSNSTALGDGASITADGQVRIGHNVSSIGGPQSWTNTSDGRFKTDVTENVPGLAFIEQLRPVTYYLDVEKLDDYTGVSAEYRNDPVAEQAASIASSQLRTGFIAQDVEKAAQSVGYNFSGVDTPKNSKDVYGLRYAEFVVPLVKAVQEQQQTIETQNQQMELLKKDNVELKARLDRLEKLVEKAN
ncbi:MAG: hypothetical protein DRI89_09720 [Bacteroidetes bacterium]|nr:MAG: hypothetical protein DRI89_09720 [Bacteroidota bacterium]